MSIDQNTQINSVSGGPYDAALATTAEKFKQGRVPRLGTRVAFDDGRVFSQASNNVQIQLGKFTWVLRYEGKGAQGTCLGQYRYG